jgi:hypothetical protein
MKKILFLLIFCTNFIIIYPKENELPHFKLITEELKPFNFYQNKGPQAFK